MGKKWLKQQLLAVVDIGGNSISLEVRKAKSPYKKDKKLSNKIREFCGLAQGIGKDGLIEDSAQDSALETLAAIKAEIQRLKAEGYNIHTRVIGTAPFRDAKNGQAFAQRIKNEIGFEVETISGEQEAELAGLGVLAHFPTLSGIVIDTGGGSTEFALLENGEITHVFSLPLGMRRIASSNDPEGFIRDQLAKLPIEFHNNTPIILTGGINRALAKAYAHAHDFKIHKYDRKGKPYEIEQADYNSFIHQIQIDPDLQEEFKVKSQRRGQIETATLLIDALQDVVGAENVILTKANMRDGVRAQMRAALEQQKVTVSQNQKPESFEFSFA
ncbi:MAG: hypothetical protein KDJ35_02975 [Alphaproteobacteria bacterium]|nr:hypothetical protein [Alphaproteobacteria bacterium]